MKTFYPEVKHFTKNGDKLHWIKYWQMTFNLPNVHQSFPLPQFLCYMVVAILTIFFIGGICDQQKSTMWAHLNIEKCKFEIFNIT